MGTRIPTQEHDMHSRYTAVRLAFFASAVLPGLALAQQPPPASTGDAQAAAQPAAPDTGVPAAAPPPAERKAAGEEIVVTGSRVRRKDLTTPAPVTVVTRDQISASGIASIGDFLQQMPEEGGGTNTNVNNGGDGETQFSLRNLGSVRTLVLVDGKRWPYGGSGPGTGIGGVAVDLNTIPNAAIERIEVLKDGASAVYGSDAIGGVVNIITRKKVNGVEASAYGGLSPKGDAQQYEMSVTGGLSSEKGSFMFTAGYFDQRPMLASNRDWAVQALAYDFGSKSITAGGSGTIPAGRVRVDPSTCATKLCQDLLAKYGPGATYFMPDATSPDSVDGWRKYDSDKDLYNFQAVNYLITPNTRYSLFSNGEYRLGDSTRAYVQGSLVNRQSTTQLASEPMLTQSFGVTIAPDNQFNPFGVPLFDARRRLVESSGRIQGFDLDTVHASAGFDGTLPEAAGPLHGMFWDLSFNFGRTAGITTTNGSLNTQLTGNGLGPSYQDATGWHCGTDPATGGTGPIANCSPVNLFGGAGSMTPAMLAALGGYTGINEGWYQLAAVQANVSHELFNIASERPVGLAAGYEYRREYGGYAPNSIAQQGLDSDYNGTPTKGSFYVNEGYAELDAPLISHVAFAEDLELQAAARVFNYSTFGGGSTYKLGLRWRPVRDLTVRGTYSTGFRAPSVADLYGGALPSAESASDPCAAIDPKNAALKAQCLAGPGGVKAVNNGDDSSQLSSTVGGNPALQPEKSKSGTIGLVFEPQVLRNFSATVDYWNVAINQNLGFITTPIILAGCYPASVGSSDPSSAAYCNLVTRSANTGAITNVNDFETNVGSTKTSGVDFAVRYSLPTDLGRFGFLFDSTYLLGYDYSLASGKTYHAAGNYDLGAGVPSGGLTPRLKFNVGVNYGLAGFTAGVRGRFIGGFDECADSIGGSVQTPGGGPGFCTDQNVDPNTGQPYAPHRVPSNMTFDLFASYTLKSDLGATQLSAGVRNVLNADPPQVFQSYIGYADTSYDFIGRFVYARLEQRF
jgi:iron complex outermembrane recepter protein